jgi:serine/threonine protein kinase
MTGKLPYNKNLAQIIKEIKTKKREPISPQLYPNQELRDLVDSLMTIQQADRSSIKDILSSPIIR